MVNDDQLTILQLRQNKILRLLKSKQWEELQPLLCIAEYEKGELLAHQGRLNIEQFFVIDGILKKSVTNRHGKEIILSFSTQHDTEGAYVSWRLRKPYPYSIAAVTQVRVAKIPIQKWRSFIERHSIIKEAFEREIFRMMNEELTRLVGLHHLGAYGRVHALVHHQSELLKQIPQKELAKHLSISAETLCRLARNQKCFVISEKN